MEIYCIGITTSAVGMGAQQMFPNSSKGIYSTLPMPS